MGGGLRFLGFNIPFDVAKDNEPRPPYDRQPVIGFCDCCKRRKTVTYLMWDGRRVCREDIDDTIRVLGKKRLFRRRPIGDTPPVENKEPSEPWDRQRVWDRWFT